MKINLAHMKYHLRTCHVTVILQVWWINTQPLLKKKKKKKKKKYSTFIELWVNELIWHRLCLIWAWKWSSSWSITGTYNTQELPCGIRVAANPWLVKMARNITSSGWPQDGLSPWGPQGARAVLWVPLIPNIALFSFLHAPSAPPMTVANHWPVSEIVLPSKFSG